MLVESDKTNRIDKHKKEKDQEQILAAMLESTLAMI